MNVSNYTYGGNHFTIHVSQMIMLLCLVTKSCLTLCNPMYVAHQAPLSMGFLRQEYWSGLSFPSPGDLPDPGIESRSCALADGFFTTEPLESPQIIMLDTVNTVCVSIISEQNWGKNTEAAALFHLG